MKATCTGQITDWEIGAIGAMVIRRRDAEAGADADAETQMTIDFDAEGSSTDAY